MGPDEIAPKNKFILKTRFMCLFYLNLQILLYKQKSEGLAKLKTQSNHPKFNVSLIL